MPVPDLERKLGPTAASGAAEGAGPVGAPSTLPAQGANPDWNPRQRIPNYNARVLSNEVYGPGMSSDRYGQVVYHKPGLRVEESALGAGDYQDQYGRPVRCYGTGMGTFCQ
ncbi:hypothetical protein [Tropicimonas sp.]